MKICYTSMALVCYVFEVIWMKSWIEIPIMSFILIHICFLMYSQDLTNLELLCFLGFLSSMTFFNRGISRCTLIMQSNSCNVHLAQMTTISSGTAYGYHASFRSSVYVSFHIHSPIESFYFGKESEGIYDAIYFAHCAQHYYVHATK